MHYCIKFAKFQRLIVPNSPRDVIRIENTL